MTVSFASFEILIEKIRKYGLSWTEIYNARNKIFTDLKLVVICHQLFPYIIQKKWVFLKCSHINDRRIVFAAAQGRGSKGVAVAGKATISWHGHRLAVLSFLAVRCIERKKQLEFRQLQRQHCITCYWLYIRVRRKDDGVHLAFSSCENE